MADPRPLDPVRSIKTKLGLLVAVSVVAAGLLVALGSASGVPWWLTLPVSVALALGLTQLLAAGMTAPLRQMTDAAGAMSRGDYSVRVHTLATDEVGRLAAAFNAMAADLSDLDRERRDLVATVSHELRTPLTAMTALLENLADGVVPADAEQLGRALAQAERLRDLVADLLELSRLEAGVAALDVRDVELAALVAAATEEVRAAGRTVEYDARVPAALDVRADPARLRQVLVNVLDNAGRHAPARTAVRIDAGEDDRGWWLEVADAGPGVAPEQRERVFERFGTDAAGGGTGVGLAIARWAAQLHGGTLRFLDPVPGEPGARLRLALPAIPPSPRGEKRGDEQRRQEKPVAMTQTPPPPSPPPPSAPTGGVSGGPTDLVRRRWPERPGLPGPRVVLGAALVGLLAGATLLDTWPGLAWALVLWAAGAAALVTARHRRDPFTLLCSVLAALLVLPLVLLDTTPVIGLCVLAAAAVFLVGTARGRSVPGFVLSWAAWPLSALRGLPWLGRSVRISGSSSVAPAVVRTIAWSVLGIAVFGLLFASADALFASWVDAVVPDLTFGSAVLRGFIAAGVGGLTLAGAYAALNPPRVETERTEAPALRNRFEWLAPVLLVDAVFVAFLAAQATAAFGGHAYLERTTGVTYADYVHQGFGQLTVATGLTLVVVAVAARYAGRSPADRRWLRASLGLLCLLTLVVVASALYRMHVYQEAYGFTRLRLVVDVFEGWLGVVVILVMVCGLLGRGTWIPRLGLVTGAVALLGLAAINPDAWVAEQNIDRFEASGRLDLTYLGALSADAAPVIVDRLPEEAAVCVLADLPDEQLSAAIREDLWSWNLGRQRAEASVDALDPARVDGQGCGNLVESYARDR
ncbi:DUF4153 domain-containing protein [Nocardioides rotundus]|uniref:DUF4153 domain-containing protein n=1 Tax=Nocardioides rotundus TaxID=1774216 RepID=UPI001CBBE414|nr:DUF4153 domain-containing protein [Nocardioides rotundus]